MDGDRRLGDRFPDDPKVAGLGHFPLQRNDHVVPRGVGCLGYVGWARVGLGVGMAVYDADHFKPTILRVSLDQQVLLRVDRVDACRLGEVVGGVELEHLAERTLADEESARLMRVAGNHVFTDLVDHRLRYA